MIGRPVAKHLIRLAALLGMTWQVFAASSLVLTPGLTGSFADPAQTQQQKWRVEFQIHDWDPAGNSLAAKLVSMTGSGFYVSVAFNLVWVLMDRDSSQCLLPLSGRTNVLIRVQRDPVNARLSCEEWNYDGTGYSQVFDPLRNPSSTQSGGATMGSSLVRAQLAYFRMFDTLLADGSPPLAAATGNLVNFKFDGDTLDSSGLSRHLTLPGATFLPTPNQGAAYIPKRDFFLQ